MTRELAQGQQCHYSWPNFPPLAREMETEASLRRYKTTQRKNPISVPLSSNAVVPKEGEPWDQPQDEFNPVPRRRPSGPPLQACLGWSGDMGRVPRLSRGPYDDGMVTRATPIAPQRNREVGSDTCFLLCEVPMKLAVVEPAPVPPHPVTEEERQPARSYTCWR